MSTESKTTNEERIDRLEKTVLKLQEQLNGLYEAKLIAHNTSIDQAVHNLSAGVFDGIF